MLNSELATPWGIRTLKERTRKAARRMEVRHRILRLGVLSIFLLSSLNSSLPGCQATYFWVAEEMFPRQLALGVQGKNRITVPDLNAVNDLWVNSIWAYKDQRNWVELGWYAWQGADGEKHWNIFGRKTVGGEYVELFDLPAAAERDYQFSLIRVSDTDWEFKVLDLDSGALFYNEQYYAPLETGYPIAQQERHNRCLHKATHWWDLGYWSGFNWHPWPGMTFHYDNDPDYEVTRHTTTELWIEKEGP